MLNGEASKGTESEKINRTLERAMRISFSFSLDKETTTSSGPCKPSEKVQKRRPKVLQMQNLKLVRIIKRTVYGRRNSSIRPQRRDAPDIFPTTTFPGEKLCFGVFYRFQTMLSTRTYSRSVKTSRFDQL